MHSLPNLILDSLPKTILKLVQVLLKTFDFKLHNAFSFTKFEIAAIFSCNTACKNGWNFKLYVRSHI